MKIATFVDDNGETLSFGEAGTVELYDKDGEGWYCVNCIPFKPDKSINISLLRQCIYKMVAQLGGCELFVVKKTKGIFKAIFEEELGIKIWTLDGAFLESLDQIQAQAEREMIENATACTECSKASEAIQPEAVGNTDRGLYRINLVEVQNKNCSLNSKEILLPFLAEKNFRELEIICIHPPKWLNEALQTLHMEMKTEKRKNDLFHTFIYLIE
ncbi:MAG: Fe-only nitrogenase accessory protein AnfO [Candidatus Symbiothrix sp.]|jgi:Fe-only nitrogenase accessory protein AnfO|nr:Fe-only nitrogenase accessory protein AnfO [Candidatus Symbiothrix sp.]